VWARGFLLLLAPHTTHNLSGLCAQPSVGAVSGQKTPECTGLPAKALVQDVVMGRKGKEEVGRAWCEWRWLGGLAPSPDWAS
jgi:hypothetical protein